MRRTRFAAVTVFAALVGLIATAAASAEPPPGVKTTKPPYLVPTAPGVKVDPILSTGDIVGDPVSGYQMSGIPDGLGAYANRGRGKTFTVVMNHELGRTFPNSPPGVDARISRLRIDRKSTSVLDATYLFDGTEGFERFCSSTLELIRGVPYYFTGEEAIAPGPVHDGSSIVMNARTGEWRETPHFGHLQHENVVPMRLSKWVFLTTDDDFRPGQPAYLYAYIARTFEGGVSGSQGSLYVWKADDASETGNATATKGESIPGRFVPITQAENASSVTLKDAATAKGAFKFDRLEDAAVRSLTSNRVYIADTGKLPATERGRIYQLDISRSDPTRATLRMILNGDAPDSDDLVNPDNMDVSRKALVIQEDRESAFRGDVGGSTGFNRVLVYDLKSKTLRSVARVATPATLRPGTWESSGVINARHVLGRNWWLLDVQAHSTTAPQPGPTLEPNSSTGEDGQLLAIRIPGSQ
jgi:Bacterial protein of unknown function (DUF839)